MLEDIGDIPKLTTVDWVPGVSHSGEDMMASDAVVDKAGVCLFEQVTKTEEDHSCSVLKLSYRSNCKRHQHSCLAQCLPSN